MIGIEPGEDAAMSYETCVRCGEAGEDRRTLRMSCFYKMEELGIPFGNQVVFTTDTDKVTKVTDPVTIPLKSGRQIVLTSGTVETKEPLTPQHLYTLRVCKSCRSEWLEVIKDWFNDERVRLQACINELEEKVRSLEGEEK